MLNQEQLVEMHVVRRQGHIFVPSANN